MSMQAILDRFPGVSCAWTDAAGHVETACFGVADRENNIPVDEDTMFPACSISKFVTAICMMKLYENRLADIDKPANAYLRRWKLHTPDGAESDATIRSLLCHTAGVADGEDAFYGLRKGEPPVSLLDILEGRTAYNNRPARAEKSPGTAFEYSDAGYCILQLLVEEITGRAFEDAARTIVFDPLGLERTFFATPGNVEIFTQTGCMAVGYDGDGVPIPGKYPVVPDLAASALWSTPKELLTVAGEFLAALKGESVFLTETSARTMAAPVERFPWTGLGLFMAGDDVLMAQGWGENGQCMLKMNPRMGAVSVVMTNRNPEVDQAASGVEWLADRNMGV